MAGSLCCRSLRGECVAAPSAGAAVIGSGAVSSSDAVSSSSSGGGSWDALLLVETAALLGLLFFVVRAHVPRLHGLGSGSPGCGAAPGQRRC